ncbi:hypothetical protein KRR26_32240 [Corallococcus sp. M34]|nr:hypothetical protein [Citreicoccus inhibens]
MPHDFSLATVPTRPIPTEKMCQRADAPLLRTRNIKDGLDIDWSAPDVKLDTLNPDRVWQGAQRHDERLQQRLRTRPQSRPGCAQLRKRVSVEHRPAHLANRQGPKARDRGTRRNLFDIRRLAVAQNLEIAARYLRAS